MCHHNPFNGVPRVASMRLAVVLLLLLVSGCLAAVPGDVAPDDGLGVAPVFDAETYLAGVNWTTLPDAEAVLTDLTDFVAKAPRRFDNRFEHDIARDILEASYVAAGYNVTRDIFTGPAQVPGMETLEGQNIIATLPGRDPSKVLMLGGHYDSAFNGYGGAYDDGLGTFIALGLARAMADYEWEHTLVFTAWDQEEAGLVGSGSYAQRMREDNVTELTLFMNFDMTGISWPAKVGGVNDMPIKAGFGGDREEQFVQWWQIARAHLGYPEAATTTSTGLGTGSSDHGSFRSAELPAAWVRGALIGTYPGYHNADTVETMIVDVGGDRADLVAGIDATMQLVFAFAFLVDAGVA